MPGCMIMVGDTCNPALKLIVDGLCTALAALLAASPRVPAGPPTVPRQTGQRHPSHSSAVSVQPPARPHQPQRAGVWRRQQAGQGRGGPQSSVCQQPAARRMPCALPLFLCSAVWSLRYTSMSGSITRSTIR